MAQHGEDVPAYRTVRVTAPDAPVAAIADLEAWQARDAYPEIVSAGGPVFGVAREREEGGWELHPHFSNMAPQGARDGLAAAFRGMAQEAQRTGDRAARAECLKAAERLDWKVLDEMTVLDSRYRVVRAERFVRTGPDGPEPPRPSDPDPAAPGTAHKVPDPAAGLVLDTTTATGMSEGILKVELLSLVCKAGTVPPDMRADSLRAARTHPGGVLLPPTFMTAERIGKRWAPDSAGTSTTPQEARDALAVKLRVLAPVLEKLGPQERAQYARAADRLDEERGAELTVAGRHYRVVRVERLVRVGPDGPEGPRPSDHDPEPPVMVHERQLRAQGLLTDDEDAQDEPDETAQELFRLFEEERLRRERLDEQR